MINYKTFVAEGVLIDWSSGMIAVKAVDKNKAIELVMKTIPYNSFIVDCGMESCDDENCLTHRLRELKDDEVVYVHGGG